MAVFVSFSDESSGKNKRDPFVFAGWVATHKDWREIFTPAWEHLVLKGPPPIPFVHMTDMYSPKWREAHRISKSDANHRIDQAVKALAAANDYIVPIELSVSGAEVSDQMGHVRMGVSKRKSYRFDPDYLCFLAYARVALEYVHKHHPDCEKLEFVVERNGPITDHIKEFHSSLPDNSNALGMGHLAKLVGELLPAGKDRVPLQAADVLCWHTARAKQPHMNSADRRRYDLLWQRNGIRSSIGPELVREMAVTLFGADE